MPLELAGTVSKAVVGVLTQLFSVTRTERKVRRLRDAARPLMAHQTAAGLLGELSPAEAAALAGYLVSPDFEQVAAQAVVARAHPTAGTREEHLSAVREQIRHGLRLAVGVPGERLLGLTDVVLDAVQAAVGQRALLVSFPEEVAAQGHLTALGVRNGALLGGLTDLRGMHEDLNRLRSQVAHLHAEMRMPQSGRVRSVSWEQLYVEPALRFESPDEITVEPDVLVDTGARHVILGDPGAGKSTLAAKLAHDLAADPDGTAVPLLVVLRNFSARLQQGERTLAEYLVAAAKDPYNVGLTAEAVDYLLMNGRAVVILDGVDELTDVALRSRVADLVKGFVLLHPLVPVIATSRRVGYADAPMDAALFRPLALATFDRDRVETYARRWFALDDGSPPSERERLASAFLRESESIEDLRSSPLLLSVLCTMYATDHYIPGNRGEIYERCALMVFDRWDRMRGISRALGFEGRVRGAVQHLAWTMFTRQAVPELPRRQILRIVRDYLIGKGFDEDQAAETAAEFLDYCAGRAWILAEVGSTATEPVFGFAHRTFLEFFSAEFLVRAAQTPESLWTTLSPHIRVNGWEVVAQLALQLADRNTDDGGDVVLRLALDEMAGAPPGERDALGAFCARSLGDVCVSPAAIGRIVTMAVDRARAFGIPDRFVVAPLSEDFTAVRAADLPLYDVLYRALPGNLPFVRSALAEALSASIEAGDRVALVLSAGLNRAAVTEDDERKAVWTRLAAELRERHETVWQKWFATSPLERIRDDEVATEIMDRDGALPFYLSDLMLLGAGYPWVLHLLVENIEVVPDEPVPLRALAHHIREMVMRRADPWLPKLPGSERSGRRDRTTTFAVRRLQQEPLPAAGEDLATRLVLYLPYIEYGFSVSEPASVVTQLRDARQGKHPVRHLRQSLIGRAIPPHVCDFLVRWAGREVNTVGGDPPAWIS